MSLSAERSGMSSLRSEQARATRMRVASAAVELFLREGYTATTMAAIARHAGVSTQTVYNTYRTKAAVLKAAYDITLVGDAEPVPLADRAEVTALHTDPDPASLLAGYAALGRRLLERVGPLMLQIAAGAAAGEPDLVKHRLTTAHERLAGTGMVARRVAELGALAPGLTVEQARDRIWTLNSVEVWNLLTRDLGWSGDAYQDWIGEAMCDAVLAHR